MHTKRSTWKNFPLRSKFSGERSERKKMSIPRKHHFLSKFYLEEFKITEQKDRKKKIRDHLPLYTEFQIKLTQELDQIINFGN